MPGHRATSEGPHCQPLAGDAAPTTVPLPAVHAWAQRATGTRADAIAYLFLCLLQVAQRRGHPSPALEPEVLSVFVPPFVSKEDGQVAGTSCGTLGRTKRRSFRKKREKPRADPGLGPAGPRETDTEDISVPDGVDLLALPQLCFPGTCPDACA